ncbi:MAG: N-acetylglucosamine-6-phosphate deacetylase [Planctomycetota bacterium]|jgi:N-acetylglucosamine-6-phosphate deacetylase
MDQKKKKTFARNLIVRGGDVFTPAHMPRIEKIAVIDGKFAHVGEDTPIDGEEDARAIDASGLMIVPGFIDIHLHGAGGRSVTDGTAEAVLDIARAHQKTGTTRLLPTIISSPPEKIHTSLKAIRDAAGMSGGEGILGAHIEGPWLNEEKAGLHNKEYLSKPDLGFAKELVSEYPGLIRLVTISPELIGARKLIEFLSGEGVIVSIGHTVANYDQTKNAFAAGATGVTHIFNAMAQIHHRNPGPLGAIFDNATITAELIADGHHVSPWAIAFLVKLHGPWNIALVTDSLPPAGTTRKLYQVGEEFVELKNGGAFREDGSVFGSILTMTQAIKNMRSFTELQMEDIFPMASSTPAAYLHIDGELGSIREGLKGDLILLDQNLDVQYAVIEGKLAYKREEGE